MIEEDDDDDGFRPDGSELKVYPDCFQEDEDSDGSGSVDSDSDEITHNTDLDPEDVILYSIDCLEDDNLCPIQSNENQYSNGVVQKN